MPHFKSINFYQNEPKFRLFFKKIHNFRGLGTPPPDPRNTPSSLQASGDAPESNHALALQIFMQPELSLIPAGKASIFIKISLKLSYFYKKKSSAGRSAPRPLNIVPLPTADTRGVLFILPSFRILQ